MKYVLVTFRTADPNLPGSGYRYPKRYSADRVQSSGSGKVLYDFTKGFDANGEQECLVLVDDALADRFATDPDMRIITDDQATAWVAANLSVAAIPEYSVDEPLVAAVHARVAANMETAEDREFLDPDHDSPGVRRVNRTKEALFDVRGE